jgi:archaellum component FlaF (FlaF/FlaG flagellin family)
MLDMRGQSQGTRGRKSRRRGLSSVVGAVFLIIVMVVALNAMVLTMREQERVSMAVTGDADTTAGRLNERIEISNIRVESTGKMNMTVSNAGGQAAVLKALYVVDETASPKQQYRYDLNSVVDGSKPLKNVGQDLPFTASPTSSYSVRVITASGNTASATFTPPSALGLPMALYVIPPTVMPGEDVTLLYAVTNNSTDGYLASDVVPQVTPTPAGCSPGPGCQLVFVDGPTPGSAKIPKGATTLFKWTYKADMPDKTTFTFTATVAGAKPGNFATANGKVAIATVSSSSFTSERIISSQLVSRPGIFLTVPGPFGGASQTGVWAVTLSNPTESPMEVTRVLITLYSPKAGGSQQMFKATDCGLTPIYPNPGSEWSCVQDNILEWKNVGSPQTVDPVSSKSFIVRVKPGDINLADEPAFQIVATVFTSLGQFAATGYSSNMADSTTPIANVYLTNTTDTGSSGALNNNKIFAHMNNIDDDNTVTIHVAVADFETSSANYIKSGTKLIINVPRNFTDVAVTSSAGFTVTDPDPTPFPDGSTQIVATLSEPLGDTTSAEAKVLRFTAHVDAIDINRVFIMHVLLDGETNSNFSVAAFAQIPLQVIA